MRRTMRRSPVSTLSQSSRFPTPEDGPQGGHCLKRRKAVETQQTVPFVPSLPSATMVALDGSQLASTRPSLLAVTHTTRSAPATASSTVSWALQPSPSSSAVISAASLTAFEGCALPRTLQVSTSPHAKHPGWQVDLRSRVDAPAGTRTESTRTVLASPL